MLNKNIYKKQILRTIPRILNQLNRDPISPTYGCFDREYWAWCTKDFANSDLQRLVFPLAFLWKNKFSGNIYCQNKKIYEWMLAGLKFWCSLQKKDGSFDHLYLHEHSYVGVAFTLYEIAETFRLISDFLELDFKSKLLVHIKRAANFLVDKDETHGFISNHRAGAACALYVVYELTKNEKYKTKAQWLIKDIANKQSEEGWFLEYGGADPGYQTLCTYYLASYWKISKANKVLDMLKKSLKFIVYFVHPNGTIGGEYGSRNTEVYYPSGFEILSFIPEAQAVADAMLASIKNNQLVTLNDIDIRNLAPLASNYVVAFSNFKARSVKQKLPYEIIFETYFPKSQIFVKSNQTYYAILSISKGGVLKVYNKKMRSCVYSNCGYFGEYKNKKISSQMLFYRKGVQINGSTVIFSSPAFIVPNIIMTPTRFSFFRAYNTIFRTHFLNSLIRKFFISGFVLSSKKFPLRIERKFGFLDKSIEISDGIYCRTKLKSLTMHEKFATIFMASSRYFQPQELALRLERIDYSDELSKRGFVEIEKSIII